MFVDDEDVIKSVQRVFEILEWYDSQRRPVGATDVARGLHYPVSSTSSLLKSMVACGYVAFDPIHRTYFPTLRLNRQSSWLDCEWYGSGRLRGLVRELQQMTGEVVSLSCRNDLQMTFVDVVKPVEVEDAGAEAGASAPLFNSSVGAAALSCHTDREIAGLIERYNRRAYRPQAKVNAAMVLPMVRQARAAGHIAGYGLYREQTGAVAWAIPARRGGPPVVVAVAGPKERVYAAEEAIVAAGRSALRRFTAAGI